MGASTSTTAGPLYFSPSGYFHFPSGRVTHPLFLYSPDVEMNTQDILQQVDLLLQLLLLNEQRLPPHFIHSPVLI